MLASEREARETDGGSKHDKERQSRKGISKHGAEWHTVVTMAYMFNGSLCYFNCTSL